MMELDELVDLAVLLTRVEHNGLRNLEDDKKLRSMKLLDHEGRIHRPQAQLALAVVRADLEDRLLAKPERTPIRLYADDCRPIPPRWRGARTVEEAKVLMRGYDVEELSLDYDFGFSQPTGLELVHWMRLENCWPRAKPEVHSDHPRAGRMIAFIEHYWPGGTDGG
jgi:hypothetical protein